MRLRQTRFTRCGDRRNRAGGFTLVEVLAALLFMAILVPVAMQAVRVASRAGQVGARKVTAMRVAVRVMNDLLVTQQLQQNGASGQIAERHRVYEWSMRSEPWTEDRMNLVSVTVKYQVQGQEYDVTLATLVDPAHLSSMPTQ